MTGTVGMRGQLNLIMNQLVREGVINGFRTNLGDREMQDEVVVTVTSPGADTADETWHKVHQALETLPIDILIIVDAP